MTPTRTNQRLDGARVLPGWVRARHLDVAGLIRGGQRVGATGMLALLLSFVAIASGCAGSSNCPPSAYPQYPAYPATYPGQPAAFGMPTAGAPPAGMPPGTLPPGTMPAGAIPMTGQPPVYGQPITGGYPAYPTAGATMPPGYAQPVVGR